MELNIIQNRIYEIRGLRVMLDFDLAEKEHNSLIISLRSQIATSNEKGERREGSNNPSPRKAL